MTVLDLQRMLDDYPQDAQITIYNPDDSVVTYIEPVLSAVELIKWQDGFVDGSLHRHLTLKGFEVAKVPGILFGY